MSRHEESIGRMPNPSQFYLEWNSELSSFCYYSAEEQKRKPFELPFRFLALKFMNTITGYDEKRGQAIYSNEVSDTRLEHFRVNYRDGVQITSGIYSDIKARLNGVGGRFTRSIYAMTSKGIIVNIKLTGGQMFNFSAIEKHGHRWRDEWIEVANYDTKMYGEEKEYTVPVFGFAGTLQANESKKADDNYEIIKAYFSSKSASPAVSNSPGSAKYEHATTSGPNNLVPAKNDDDLPF